MNMFLTLLVAASTPGSSKDNPVHVVESGGLSASAIVSIVMACITAFSMLAAVSGLLYTWYTGRWKTEERVNKARQQITKFLYQNWKLSGIFHSFKSPYINPLTYYKEIGKYEDDDGEPILLDAISIQTKDMNTTIHENIIDKNSNISYGRSLTTIGLYNEPDRMTFRNVKRFNGLIAFVDKQLNDYLHNRDDNKQSLWNMKKWKAFLRILRKKLIKIRKELEALQVNEIRVKLNPDADKVIDKSKLDFPKYFSIVPHNSEDDPKGTFNNEYLNLFYSFDMYDFSKIEDKFTTGVSTRNYPFNQIVKLMSDLPGFYEREHTAAFRKQVWDNFYVDLDLHMELKQSHSDYNMKRANDTLRNHYKELKEAIRKILKKTVVDPAKEEGQGFMGGTQVAISGKIDMESLLAKNWNDVTIEDIAKVIPFMKNVPSHLVKDIKDELSFERLRKDTATNIMNPKFVKEAAALRNKWSEDELYKNFSNARVSALIKYGAQVGRHLVLTSDSIKFDVYKNAYYVHPESQEANVLLTTKNHQAIALDSSRDWKGGLQAKGLTGLNLPVNAPIVKALATLYGIWKADAKAILAEAKINPDTPVNKLKPNQIATIKEELRYVRDEAGDIREVRNNIFKIRNIKFKYFMKRLTFAIKQKLNFKAHLNLKTDPELHQMRLLLRNEWMVCGIKKLTKDLIKFYKYRQVVKNRTRGFRERHITEINTLNWAVAKDFFTFKWIRFWADLKTKIGYARTARKHLSGYEIRNILIDDLNENIDALKDAKIDERTDYMDWIDKVVLKQLINSAFLRNYPSLGSIEQIPYFMRVLNKETLNGADPRDGTNNHNWHKRFDKAKVKAADSAVKFTKAFYNLINNKETLDKVKAILRLTTVDPRLINIVAEKIDAKLSKEKSKDAVEKLVRASVEKAYKENFDKTLNDPFVFDNERMMDMFMENNKESHAPGIVYCLSSNAYPSYLQHANYFPQTYSLREGEVQTSHEHGLDI